MTALHDTIDELLALQELDKKIDEIQQQYDVLPAQLDEKRTELDAAMTRNDEIAQEEQDAKMERDSLNLELQQEQERIRQYERRLKDVKSQREHQALVRELGFAKRVAGEAETEVLKRMERLDEFAESRQEIETSTEDMRSALADLERELETHGAELQAQLDELKAKRLEHTRKLRPNVAGHYNMVRRRSSDPLAVAANGRCLGCNMLIPPQMFNRLLRMQEFITCPSCQRILYVEPKADEAAE